MRSFSVFVTDRLGVRGAGTMNEVGHETAIAFLTVGHSTRTLGVFVSLLQGNSVQKVEGMRTIPDSRHNPQLDCARSAGESYI